MTFGSKFSLSNLDVSHLKPKNSEILPITPDSSVSSLSSHSNTAELIPRKHRSRRKSNPKKSPNIPRSNCTQKTLNKFKKELGISQLDVYSFLKTKPECLLYKFQSRKSPSQQKHHMCHRIECPNVSPNTVSFGSNLGRKPMLTASFLPDEQKFVAEEKGWLSLVTLPEYSNPPLQSVPKPVHSARGSWLTIDNSVDGYRFVNEAELQLCSQLRLWPVQYLRVKAILLTHKLEVGQFKKRSAQRLCRIDINKTNKIYDWFIELGWLN